MQPDPLRPGLYIVATPIGNLGDLTPRAADILARADAIAVEDSRVTAKLLHHIGIKRPMIPYHDHNADRVRPGLIARLGSESIALVSDAGTPLISDPGYKLVRDARAAGHAVTTLPGPCAAIAAITLSGLPSDRFLFAGFLPSKAGARTTAIAEVAGIRATLIFYESGPRLSSALAALAEGLGDRDAAVAREISKTFEECVTGTLSALAARYADAPPKGEIVIVVGPPGEAEPASEAEADVLLAEALARLPAARAAGEVAKATGLNKRDLYARALALKDKPLPFRSSGSAVPPAPPETAGGSFSPNWVGVGDADNRRGVASLRLPHPPAPSPEGEGE
ncbi:16S rRNA (cytidine1402-2'-O)-methyltransferase [Sphingomonas vulcanisoli]|uniref:Ribosomal RNA small subunit methyltransferase I n=1 Tax=Sphingomonas vulcanisoli TaxID=1658060 RepID=A0ABX0TYB0_9SPHN|nr:16S rRNA (cytidine1402-2'-O)-methyltransferase [Sphingomonas vulcanisoli]